MRVFLIIGCVLFGTIAHAQELYESPASEWRDQCRIFVNPPQRLADENEWLATMNDASWCGRVVFDWLYDTGRDTAVDGDPVSIGYQPTDETQARELCGAQIILAHNGNEPIADILSAEFDQACSEAGLM